ncbi:dual specificity protein phosphatase family protein [Candidatus Woesearchaeota archaeon]|nr:dual specificity protein phosphatase family protein [Candidatus Woesearchaeota archaeon]
MVYIKHQKHIPFEYSRITDYIYLGTNQCCIKHSFARKLIRNGIEADISLESENIDAPFGAKYFLWLPVKDHTAPTQKQLLIGAKTLKGFIENKIKVYIHCKRGHGRSPTLVAAYFILQGKTAKEAIEIIRERRPSIHLRGSQIKSLKNFEKRLKNGKRN